MYSTSTPRFRPDPSRGFAALYAFVLAAVLPVLKLMWPDWVRLALRVRPPCSLALSVMLRLVLAQIGRNRAAGACGGAIFRLCFFSLPLAARANVFENVLLAQDGRRRNGGLGGLAGGTARHETLQILQRVGLASASSTAE